MREAYRRDGYVHLQDALSEADLLPLQQVIERHVHRFLLEQRAAGRITGLHEHEAFPRRLAAACEGSGIVLRKWHTFLFSREMYTLVRHPAIVNSLEQILGPEITFHGDYQLILI
jgi:hypothetical protein